MKSKCDKCGSRNVTTGIEVDKTIQDRRARFNAAQWMHKCLDCGHVQYIDKNGEYIQPSTIQPTNKGDYHA